MISKFALALSVASAARDNYKVEPPAPANPGYALVLPTATPGYEYKAPGVYTPCVSPTPGYSQNLAGLYTPCPTASGYALVLPTATPGYEYKAPGVYTPCVTPTPGYNQNLAGLYTPTASYGEIHTPGYSEATAAPVAGYNVISGSNDKKMNAFAAGAAFGLAALLG
ncbi:hypothetical protein HDV02_006195 [Globomyces sp. JEL0801]|nr:hypothetical protein HDV02_006195 [Globomyces sp. JEL0801]